LIGLTRKFESSLRVLAALLPHYSRGGWGPIRLFLNHVKVSWWNEFVEIDNAIFGYWEFVLLLSTIRIVEIDNAIFRYRQFVLLISAMRFVDIDNLFCWYRQFELWISTVRFFDIDNSYYWCQQFKLSISTIGIKLNDDSACHIGKVVSAFVKVQKFPRGTKTG